MNQLSDLGEGHRPAVIRACWLFTRWFAYVDDIYNTHTHTFTVCNIYIYNYIIIYLHVYLFNIYTYILIHIVFNIICYTHAYRHMHTHTHAYTHAYTHMHTHTHICVYIYIYFDEHTDNMYLYGCIFIVFVRHIYSRHILQAPLTPNRCFCATLGRSSFTFIGLV